MSFSRRDLLTLVGGSTVGLAFSPVPWKLLDDSSIWTQNWSWIPIPPRGEPRVRYTTCTLCPAGCAMRARGVGDAVVSLAALPGRALCPIGVAAHHLPYHSSRARLATRRGAAIAPEAAAEEIRQLMKTGPVAVLDLRPGRTASLVHRRFAAGAGGLYVVPAREPGPVDLSKAQTLISFGAPVLDGWGAPGRLPAGLRLIQIEPVESRTAALADRWIPVKPGTEAALALGLAHVLGADFARDFTPERVAKVTGVAAETIAETARAIAKPAVAIAGSDPAGGPLGAAAQNAIAGLNLALGAALPRRKEAPGADEDGLAVPTTLANVPDAGIALLIIDEVPGGDAVPWSVLRRKLAPGARVVALTAAVDGIARHADYVIPAPVFPETLQDAGAAATFSLSLPLAPQPAWAVEPAEFVMRLAGETGAFENQLKRRVAAIQTAKRGTVFNYADGKQTPAKDIEDLWKALQAGAAWKDDAPPETAPAEFTAEGIGRALEAAVDREFPLVVLPFGWRNGPASPLLSKLDRESDLRSPGGVAWMNPETARPYGIIDGARAVLRTRCGTCAVTAAFDPALMPGVVQVAVGPGPEGRNALDLCDPDGDCTWRMAPATLAKA